MFMTTRCAPNTAHNPESAVSNQAIWASLFFVRTAHPGCKAAVRRWCRRRTGSRRESAQDLSSAVCWAILRRYLLKGLLRTPLAAGDAGELRVWICRSLCRSSDG